MRVNIVPRSCRKAFNCFSAYSRFYLTAPFNRSAMLYLLDCTFDNRHEARAALQVILKRTSYETFKETKEKLSKKNVKGKLTPQTYKVDNQLKKAQIVAHLHQSLVCLKNEKYEEFQKQLDSLVVQNYGVGYGAFSNSSAQLSHLAKGACLIIKDRLEALGDIAWPAKQGLQDKENSETPKNPNDTIDAFLKKKTREYLTKETAKRNPDAYKPVWGVAAN